MSGAPISLFAAFAAVPDPRHRQGRRHRLPAILAMTTTAILAGCKSLEAISQWGRVNLVPNRPLLLRFGFTSFTTPCPSQLHEVFKALDVAALEELLGAWAQSLWPGTRARLARISHQIFREGFWGPRDRAAGREPCPRRGGGRSRSGSEGVRPGWSAPETEPRVGWRAQSAHGRAKMSPGGLQPEGTATSARHACRKSPA